MVSASTSHHEGPQFESRLDFSACSFFSVNSGVLLRFKDVHGVRFICDSKLNIGVNSDLSATCLWDVPGFSIYDSCDRLNSAVTLDVLTWDPKTTYLVLESASSGQRRNCSFWYSGISY